MFTVLNQRYNNIAFRQQLDVFVDMSYDRDYLLFWKLAISRVFLVSYSLAASQILALDNCLV